jgi:RND superfamily putative drug exporter
VDYALFIVTRHRQGLIAGKDLATSIATAVDTSGRAVLFAGIIVCIALLGMFALGVSFLYGMAIAASIGVLFTMIAALTLLPALLGFIGPKVMSRRQKRDLAQKGPRIVGTGTKGFWPRWARFVERRPVLPAVAALVVIVLVALPFFSLRLGSSDQGNDPVGTTTRQAYDLLASGFGPGFNGPLLVVASAEGHTDPAVLGHLQSAIAAQPDVAHVSAPLSMPPKDGKQVSLITVYPTSSPQDGATTDLISHLRIDTIPSVVSGTGATVDVGGTTAIFVDFANVLTSKLPLFIGLVVALSFVLLAIVFRSLLIPLTAAAMNVLSIGAAFGILVGIFQWGWASSIFGVNRAGPIEAFLPVMLFAILFGLSMDYEVFLITRIHEEWLISGDNRTAVRKGLAATGKTITAAALIMILVFGSFILGGERVIKEFGLGLAAGILMDALIIRMAIVPALMFLFGKANWWFPNWLDRVLPRLSVDPELPSSSEPEVPVADGSTPVGVATANGRVGDPTRARLR